MGLTARYGWKEDLLMSLAIGQPAAIDLSQGYAVAAVDSRGSAKLPEQVALLGSAAVCRRANPPSL